MNLFRAKLIVNINSFQLCDEISATVIDEGARKIRVNNTI